MGAAPNGVCSPWATAADLCSPCDDYAISNSLLTKNLLAASNVLFQLSGMRFPGQCTATVRPNARWRDPRLEPDRRADALGGYGGRGGYGRGGFCSCNRSDRTGCTLLPEITLGAGPIVSIQSVKVDGVTLPTTSYRVDDYRYLIRTDGTGLPCCQDVTLPSSATGTFEVAYTYGRNPPQEGITAAAALACEMVMACEPELIGNCRLPRRTQQIVRQGVSVTLVDPSTFLNEDGRTGISEVDLFLFAHNPNKLRRTATIASPDIGRRARRINT